MSQPEAPDWIVVAPLENACAHRIIPIRVHGHDLILVQDGESFWACQRLCPHEYADLAQGRIVGGKLFCGRHFASFDLTNGASGNGWDLQNLKIYPARARDQAVEVDVSAIAANPPSVRQRLDNNWRSYSRIEPAPPKKT